MAPSPPPGTLGSRIAQARRELGVRLQRDVTPADLAKLLEVNPATVYRWESDEKAPRDDALAAMAELFGLSLAYLRYGVVQAGPERPSPEELADFINKEKAAAAREREQAQRPAASKAAGGTRGRGRRR